MTPLRSLVAADDLSARGYEQARGAAWPYDAARRALLRKGGYKRRQTWSS